MVHCVPTISHFFILPAPEQRIPTGIEAWTYATHYRETLAVYDPDVIVTCQCGAAMEFAGELRQLKADRKAEEMHFIASGYPD
jgi:hypothetical protein